MSLLKFSAPYHHHQPYETPQAYVHHHTPPLPSHPPPPVHHTPPVHHPHHANAKVAELPEECFIETPCTRSCDAGFKLLLPNPSGGHACYGATLQVHPCEVKPCAVHCHWGRWSEWSACTVTGRRRRRSALTHPDADKPIVRAAPQIYHHGQPVLPPAKKQMVVGGNAVGSICTQSRQRAIELPPKHYGKPCKGEHSEARFCQSYECRGI